jgi:hypothetical protein
MSRIYIYIILSIFALSSVHAQEKSKTVSIKGIIKHYKSRPIYVTYLDDFVYFKNVNLAKTTTDDKGSFEIKFKWERPWLAQFAIGDKKLQLFLCPGDTLVMKASYGNLYHSIKYSGSSGKGQNLQKSYVKKYKGVNNRFAGKLGRLDSLDFVTTNDKHHQDQLEFINRDTLYNKDHKDFYEYLRANVDYNYLNSVFDYCEKKNRYLLTAYMDTVMDQKHVNNPYALPAVVYVEFLENYINWKSEILKPKNEVVTNYWDHRYKTAKKVVKGTVRDLILARILKKAFEYTYYVTALTLFYDYETLYLNKNYYLEIKKNFIKQ